MELGITQRVRALVDVTATGVVAPGPGTLINNMPQTNFLQLQGKEYITVQVWYKTAAPTAASVQLEVNDSSDLSAPWHPLGQPITDVSGLTPEAVTYNPVGSYACRLNVTAYTQGSNAGIEAILSAS